MSIILYVYTILVLVSRGQKANAGYQPQYPFRHSSSCRFSESICNLYGYSDGIYGLWQGDYFGCVPKGKEDKCCPPHWKYIVNSFHSKTILPNTCIVADATFIGKIQENDVMKWCEDSKWACRKNAFRKIAKGGKSRVYNHFCQDKDVPCNDKCSDGSKLFRNDSITICKRMGRNSPKTIVGRGGIGVPKIINESATTETSANQNLQNKKFYETIEGIIVFSLIGGIGLLVIVGLIGMFFFKRKQKKSKLENVESIEQNPDYGLGDDEDDIEFRDVNEDYFLPDEGGDMELVDYNENYGRASVE